MKVWYTLLTLSSGSCHRQSVQVLSDFTLAMIGYNVNEVVQTAAVKANIWKSYTAIYAVGYLIAVLILFFVYPLSKKKTEQMLEELAKRRAKGKGGR